MGFTSRRWYYESWEGMPVSLLAYALSAICCNINLLEVYLGRGSSLEDDNKHSHGISPWREAKLWAEEYTAHPAVPNITTERFKQWPLPNGTYKAFPQPEDFGSTMERNGAYRTAALIPIITQIRNMLVRKYDIESPSKPCLHHEVGYKAGVNATWYSGFRGELVHPSTHKKFRDYVVGREEAIIALGGYGDAWIPVSDAADVSARAQNARIWMQIRNIIEGLHVIRYETYAGIPAFAASGYPPTNITESLKYGGGYMYGASSYPFAWNKSTDAWSDMMANYGLRATALIEIAGTHPWWDWTLYNNAHYWESTGYFKGEWISGYRSIFHLAQHTGDSEIHMSSISDGIGSWSIGSRDSLSEIHESSGDIGGGGGPWNHSQRSLSFSSPGGPPITDNKIEFRARCAAFPISMGSGLWYMQPGGGEHEPQQGSVSLRTTSEAFENDLDLTG